MVARKVGPGQYVRNDQGEQLYVIADLSTMWLKALVPEIDIPFIKVGQDVEVKVTAVPERVFKARITHVGALFDAPTRRMVVRSEIANPDGALKAEMFASFKIAIGGERAGAGRSDGRGDPRRRSRRRMGPAGADVVPAPDGESRDGAGRPGRRSAKVSKRASSPSRGAIFLDNEWRQ